MRRLSHRHSLVTLAVLFAATATSLQAQAPNLRAVLDQCLDDASDRRDESVDECRTMQRQPEQVRACEQRAREVKLRDDGRCHQAFDQAMRQMERRNLEAQKRASARSPRPQ